MNKKLWFRAKMYGWGWYPISWEGWLVILIYAVIFTWRLASIDKKAHSGSDFLINFGFEFIIYTLILLAICYKKGERPRWRWGK